MARKKEPPCPPLALWLVTFSDLVTLLLTFFVLLLTMSSMDQSFLTRVTVQPLDMGNMDSKGAGQVSIAMQEVIEYLENPWEVMDKQNRIKDLLYPDDAMPDDISKSSLRENLKVLSREDGVALVFTDNLLFPKGGRQLDESAMSLLEQIYPLLDYMQEPIKISGFAGADEADPYDLGGDRALAVLKYYVDKGMPNERFTISTAGADKPLFAAPDLAPGSAPEPGTDARVQAKNRRVEILIRTTRALDSYS